MSNIVQYARICDSLSTRLLIFANFRGAGGRWGKGGVDLHGAGGIPHLLVVNYDHSIS
jgi:hypothetical protein